ncbi:MAG: serine hydrolase [Chitinophagales bacterium]
MQAQTIEELKEWGMDVDKVIKMNRLLKAYSWLKEFSGVVIVAKNEHPVFKYTSSYANLDYKIPNSLETRYNLTNITYVFTAIAIMQLVEEGKISRFDYLKEYVDSLPVAISEQITIHHLLTHTSGIKCYYEISDYVAGFSGIKNIDDLLDIILKQPLEFAAGTQTINSKSNYILLAKIIENLTDMPFRQYIQEKIFDPADMQSSGAYFWDETVSNKAIGYTFKENGNPIIPANSWGAFPFGADALYSTSEDLLKFMTAFNQHKFISEESAKEMLAYGVPAADSTYYQYGWRTQTLGDQEVILQNGSIQGLSVDFRYYPKDGYTTVVLSSYFEDKAQEIALRLQQVLYDEDFVVAAHPLGFFLNEIIKESGVEFVANNLDNILDTNGFTLEKVWTLYSLGYDLMDAGRLDEAGEIFRINLSKFPDEPMAYDCLGAYNDKAKNYQLALQNFEHKLQLMPGDKRALSMVKYLKEKVAKQEGL